MPNKIKIAFIGVGLMGQCAHLRNYVTQRDVEVTAIAELRPQTAATVAQVYRIPKVYSNHRDLLANEKVDGLVHIQNFVFHAQTLPELYETGLPVITEKPLANSVPTGQSLLKKLASTHGKHFVAYHKRSDPAVMRAKKQIAQWQADGTMGNMRYVRVTMPPGDWVGPGFANMIDMGEKVPPMQADAKPEGMEPEAFKYYVYLVNYYVHQVNLLRHLLGGDYEIKFADPNGRTFAGVGKGDLSKVTVVVEMAPYDTSIDWQETALVCFDKGWIKVELPRPLASDEAGKVSYYSDPRGGAEPFLTVPEMPKRHAMQQQAINFIAAIKGETTPLCTAAEAQKDLDSILEYQTLFAASGGLIKSPWG